MFGVAYSAGGDFRHTGHVEFIRSHSSIHSAWKQCLHSGMHLIVSLLRYSDKHIGQVLSLGPGILRLSPSTSFSYDSIVDSSSPVSTTAGCGSTAAGLLFCCMGLSPASLRLLKQHAKRAIPVAHASAGTAIDKQMIPKTLRPLPVWPEI